jgi:hypothetical protein
MRRTISALIATLLLAVPAAAATGASPSKTTSSTASRGSGATTGGLLVGFHNWGPLRLGMTNQRAWETGMVSKRGMGCTAGYAMTWRYRDRGFVWWRGDFPDMRIQKILITGTLDATRKGIHVGSTLRQIRHAYPNVSRVRGSGTHDIYNVYVQGKLGVLVFQFPSGGRPSGSSKIDLIVVEHKPDVYWGC